MLTFITLQATKTGVVLRQRVCRPPSYNEDVGSTKLLGQHPPALTAGYHRWPTAGRVSKQTLTESVYSFSVLYMEDKFMILNLNHLKLDVDFTKGEIKSLILKGKECIISHSPLFTIRLRDFDGNIILLNTYDAKTCIETSDGAVYSNFSSLDLSPKV